MGYSSTYKGYKCMSREEKVYFSRHVISDETKFPCVVIPSTLPDIINNVSLPKFLPFQLPTKPISDTTISVSKNSASQSHESSLSSSSSLTSLPSIPFHIELPIGSSNSDFSTSSNFTQSSSSSSRVPSLPLSKPLMSTHPMITRSKSAQGYVIDLINQKPSSVAGFKLSSLEKCNVKI